MIVPAKTEVTGSLTIPVGVSLITGGNVYANRSNAGLLVICKGGVLTTSAGEAITIQPLGAKAAEVEGNAAYFTGLQNDGVFVNGGGLTLNGVRATGDGLLEITETGEVTLYGASALRNVKLTASRTVTLGADFTADATAATIFLDDDYELGRPVLTLNGDTGQYAGFFALGDAPDQSWYVGEDGKLTSKPSTEYLLLNELVMGKTRKISAKNLLPLVFKGGVTWESSDPAVLKVTGKGAEKRIKAVKLGSAELTATFASGMRQTIPVSVVLKKSAVSQITAQSKLLLRVGATQDVKAKVKPASALDGALLWFTTDPAVATVDQTGAVTALSKGKCKVYALSGSGARKVIAVTVKAAKQP